MSNIKKMKEKGLDSLCLNVYKNLGYTCIFENGEFEYVDEEELLYRNRQDIFISLGQLGEDPIATLKASLYSAPIDFAPIDKEYNYQEIPSLFEIFDMHDAEKSELMWLLTKDDENNDTYNDDLLSKRDKDSNLEPYDLSMLYIERLDVDKEFQNLGIGTYLLQNLEEIIASKLYEKYHFAAICPDCKSDRYSDLVKLYRKCGFRTYRKSEFMIKKGTWFIPKKINCYANRREGK